MKARNMLGTAGLALCLALSGCGQSVQDRKLEIVKCGAYLEAMGGGVVFGNGMFGGGMAFAAQVQKASVSDLSDAGKLVSIISMAGDLADQLDQGKVAQAQQDGQAQEKTDSQGGDVQGATKFVKACMADYDQLNAQPQ
ncbi:hypothetical protein [Acidocella sp.]|uniref:hypothetical protein n=1 Tax=Acidocella sp. TaxID=50710 RepID=UPI00261C43FB|nr:hypothetical protein [Acidocella sp.]